MTSLNPIQWAFLPLRKYATFSGRAPRPEFWWFVLFVGIIFFALYFVMLGSLVTAGATSNETPVTGVLAVVGAAGILMFLLWLVLLIPSIAVQARRLHDTGRSAWWLGAFYLLYGLYIVLWFGSLGAMASGGMDGAGEISPVFAAIFSVMMILAVILFAYTIVLLVFWCLPGTPGANRYGPDPYGADVGEVFA